jgi:hypothetical protein
VRLRGVAVSKYSGSNAIAKTSRMYLILVETVVHLWVEEKINVRFSAILILCHDAGYLELL